MDGSPCGSRIALEPVLLKGPPKHADFAQEPTAVPAIVVSASLQTADMRAGFADVCVGPMHKVAALQPAAREQEPRGR